MARKKTKPLKSGDGASVTKAIAVLRAFVDGQSAWGVRELANALGQPGSSVHRLLQILRKDRLIEWDPDNQKYSVGMELFRWSSILSRRFKLAEVARPIMADLSAALGESCWLGLYDAHERAHAYVAEVLADRPFNYAAPLGQYEELANSAAGLAIMAFTEEQTRGKATRPSLVSAELRRIRIDGYARRLGADEDAPVTIAAPIFGARNVPIASLTVVIPQHRCPEAKSRELGSAVASAAARLSRLIGSQVVGAAATGTWHQGVNAVANLIRREVPDIGSTIASRGGDGALRDLQAGNGGYCFAVAESLGAAYRGKPPFDKRHGRLRAMCSLFPLYLHIAVKRESPIQSFIDLKRSRISAGDRDFSTARVAIELLQLAGLAANPKAAERRLVFLDYAEAHREFIETKLEVVMSLTGLDDSSYRNLARRSDIRLLSLDRALLKRFIDSHPTYDIATIPALTYPGCQTPTQTIMVPTVMVTTADRSDEEVYEVTRAIFENRKEMASTLPGFNGFEPDSIFRGINIPLHPAAERFWRKQRLIEPRKAR
jgi:TRAP transporter TAXI family solute receptor